MAKYVEVQKINPDKERIRKSLAVYLVLSVASVLVGFSLTIVGFWVGWCSFLSLPFQCLTPFFILSACGKVVEYKYGGKRKENR